MSLAGAGTTSAFAIVARTNGATRLTLDDVSRYVVVWKLCTTIRADDVIDTLDLALEASGCDRPTVLHRPRLLSDNGSSYIAGDLATWLEGKGMDHVCGAPNHPQTQGKIERWHQTLKNVRWGNDPPDRFLLLLTLLENHSLPGALEAAVGGFVEHYNHHRLHESLGNVTSADAYFGRAPAILEERRRIKEATIRQRRLLNQRRAA